MTYLLDSNIFIQCKNTLYGMDICPGFWVWLDITKEEGSVASIDHVNGELIDGNDELAEWANDRSENNWFVDTTDSVTQTWFAQICDYVSGSDFKDEAKAEFLSKADPWLIAKALAIGATIVTEETYTDSKKKIKIPYICRHFGVSYMKTVDLLRHKTASFIFCSRMSSGEACYGDDMAD